MCRGLLGRDRTAHFKRLPPVIVNVVAAIQSLETATVAAPQPRIRFRAPSGRWLVLHASYLSAEPDVGGMVAVIEPARQGEIAPLVLQTHGLTTKESEVARLALLGRSTREIAASLFISDHTVQDHFKSIFDKVGVASQRELVSRILSEQYPVFG